MKKVYRALPKGKRVVFRRWITHPVTHVRIYPRRGRAFPIEVDA